MTISIEVEGLEEVKGAFASISAFDGRKLLRQVGELIVAQTEVRIRDTKRDPDGEPWKPWSPTYEQTRLPHHSLLMDTGADGSPDALLNSIEMRPRGRTKVVVAPDSRVGYAEFVQADRPFMGLGSEDLSEIEDTVESELSAFVDEVTRGNGR